MIFLFKLGHFLLLTGCRITFSGTISPVNTVLCWLLFSICIIEPASQRILEIQEKGDSGDLGTLFNWQILEGEANYDKIYITSYNIFEVLYVYTMNFNYIRIILLGKISSQNNSKSAALMLWSTESVAHCIILNKTKIWLKEN